MSTFSLMKTYRNLYPWKTLDQFFDQIKNSIAYQSPDKSLVAIHKPFGVGIFKAKDLNSSKQNQDKLLYRLTGHPRYCIQDVLEPLAQELGSSEKFEVVKGIDRYMSGLVLISNDSEKIRTRFLKSIFRCKAAGYPPYGLRAITVGYPSITGSKLKERIGLQMIEVDELGDHKEPIIVRNPSKRFVEMKDRERKIYQVELEVKKTNKSLAVSLVEFYVSSLRTDFPRVYISNQTSFILGDVRFSKRIREILGRPIQVSAFKSSHRYEDDYEPLNAKLRGFLGVDKNASVPLMLDLHAIRLKGFDRAQESRDLFIQSPYKPLHFALTAKRLELDDHDGPHDDRQRR